MRDITPMLEEFGRWFTGEVVVDRDIAFPGHLRRDALDYSVDSLHVVDDYLTFLHENQSAIPEDEWNVTVLRAGAYIGEVLRKASHGAWAWVDYDDVVPNDPKLQSLIPDRLVVTCALLTHPQAGVRFPLNKIARFIADGSENSTHYFIGLDVRQRPARPN
jgi:hypothetical protein